MKGAELMPQLAAALRSNTTCADLNLTGCNLDDNMIEPLAQALESNAFLTSVNLEGNRINNDGAMMIARALKANRSVLTLNLLNQKGTRFGDTTLGEFTVALEEKNRAACLHFYKQAEKRKRFKVECGRVLSVKNLFAWLGDTHACTLSVG